MNTRFALLGLIALGAGLAAGTTYTLSINGTPSPSPAIVVNGKTYVPLEALKASGVKATLSAGSLKLTLPGPGVGVPTTAEGGANQNAALERCRNQWLFNGVWRFRVSAVEPFVDNDQRGWRVSVELRNGSKANALALGGTGLAALSLVLSDGNQLNVSNIVDIRDPALAQGASLITKLGFFDTTGISDHTPKKLLLILKPSATDLGFLRQSGAVFSGKDPSMRVNLDCQK